MNAVELANQADLLTRNAAYKAAMAGVRDGLIRRLEDCPIADHSMQHEIALSLQLLKQVDRHLQSFIQTGQIEQKREKERNWLKLARGKIPL